MLVSKDYKDERLKNLLIQTLKNFDKLNENSINHVVAIFHYLGKINAGRIYMSQSDVFSLKWEAIMADLVEEGLVGIEEKSYREYFLKNRNFLQPQDDLKDALEELKKIPLKEWKKIAIKMHSDSRTNCHNNCRLNATTRSIKEVLDMYRISSSTT